MTQSKLETDSHGIKRCRNEQGQLHREDGPAVEYPSGFKIWWVNGKQHRLDGPAFEYADGHKEWWVNGNKCTTYTGWHISVKEEFSLNVIMFLLDCNKEVAKLIISMINE
jgi:hypothetical protein